MLKALGLVFLSLIVLRVLWFIFGVVLLFVVDLHKPYNPDE
jgi:hypothetical protein